MLPSGHGDEHLFTAGDGKRYRWYTDMECDCDSCQSDDSCDWCTVYWEEKGGERG